MTTHLKNDPKDLSEALRQFLEFHSMTLEVLLELEDESIFDLEGCTVQLMLEMRSFRTS
jgi:hypothetical protein